MLRYGCFLISALFVLIPGISSSEVLLDRVVAVVNAEVITWSELYRKMETDATPQTKALSEEERLKVFKESEEFFLEKLIDEKLQVQEARKQGIQVSENEINDTIENIRKRYAMTEEEFKRSLEKEGLEYEEYRGKLGAQILVSKVIDRMIRKRIVVSEEEIDRYLNESGEEIDRAESYRVRQILFKTQNKAEESIAIEKKAALVIQKLQAGEDFADLAQQYSDDPSSAGGGDLGFIKKEHFSKEFIDVISLMKPGEFSDPFWTESGLHIIQLVEIAEGRSQHSDREKVREMLSEKLFTEKYTAWIKGLREKAFIEIRL